MSYGPISLTSATRFTYLILNFHTSNSLKVVSVKKNVQKFAFDSFFWPDLSPANSISVTSTECLFKHWR